MKKQRVVIIGGGFGGLAAAKALHGKDVHLTLIDKRNYHLFQPLLYQVAMAGLSPAEIAYPLRSLLHNQQETEILLGEVEEVNRIEKYVRTETNKVHFDYLIIACGSTYTYFNSPQWEPFAPGLKTIAQATEIRRRVFLAFEEAEREPDPKKRHKFLNFVIVGGGPTGVELSGSLGEITRYSIKADFHHIKPNQAKIILVEGGNRILSSMSEALSNEAMKELNELGVEVRLGQKVTEINANGIQVGDEFIESTTILWAAGVAASPLNKTLGTELDGQGRVIVNADLSIPNHPDIFVIGDQAHYKWGADKSPLPGLAPVAMQQGRFVANLISHKNKNSTSLPVFKFVDKGQMATIGRSRAVAMFRGLEFHGILAWFAWLFVHIYYLIGFKNRTFVLFQWAFTYLTFRRGARLIIDKK
jgi:NADH dehydrogenase